MQSSGRPPTSGRTPSRGGGRLTPTLALSIFAAGVSLAAAAALFAGAALTMVQLVPNSQPGRKPGLMICEEFPVWNGSLPSQSRPLPLISILLITTLITTFACLHRHRRLGLRERVLLTYGVTVSRQMTPSQHGRTDFVGSSIIPDQVESSPPAHRTATNHSRQLQENHRSCQER